MSTEKYFLKSYFGPKCFIYLFSRFFAKDNRTSFLPAGIFPLPDFMICIMFCHRMISSIDENYRMLNAFKIVFYFMHWNLLKWFNLISMYTIFIYFVLSTVNSNKFKVLRIFFYQFYSK